ncbi:MAG: lytic transglycosylase domain-containing protein [Rhodobacteraceae bacterium]|nr:lytic transglycosylase domain-containing protein [Paracoccaceae bacterium]
MKNSRLSTAPPPGPGPNRLCRALVIALLALGLLPAAWPAFARPELCEAAAAQAAQEVGVPTDVLLAIALTETGRGRDGRMRPWPWAANTDGRGHWFDSRDAALAFLRDTLARGQRSIDLGCFQINLRWHGMHFATPEAILDPITSARYAARHLFNLHREFGTWEAAAGAYHSRTPRHNARYRARFAELRAGLHGRGVAARLDEVRTHAPRPAPSLATPLLAGAPRGASLVPVSASGDADRSALGTGAGTRPFIVMHP